MRRLYGKFFQVCFSSLMTVERTRPSRRAARVLLRSDFLVWISAATLMRFLKDFKSSFVRIVKSAAGNGIGFENVFRERGVDLARCRRRNVSTVDLSEPSSRQA